MPAKHTLSILFIGNSYTNRNDLPGMLERLGAGAMPSVLIKTDRVIANGVSLKTHWDHGAADMIARQAWDFVVLQDQSTMPLKNPAKLKEYVAKFDAVCRERGARSAVYLTWARADAPQRQDEITQAYRDAAAAAGAVVLPVGVAWARMLAEHRNIVLHDRDKSHPSLAGTYLAACVMYAALLKRSPLKLPALEMKPDVAELLRQCARDAVQA